MMKDRLKLRGIKKSVALRKLRNMLVMDAIKRLTDNETEFVS